MVFITLGPGGPGSPFSPGSPLSPLYPRSPFSPLEPARPEGPGGPRRPGSPGNKQYRSSKAFKRKSVFTVTSIRGSKIYLGKTLPPQILENLFPYIVRQTPDEKC